MSKEIELESDSASPPTEHTSPARSPNLDATANDISFRAVDDVNVSVRNLSVNIDVSPNGIAALKTSFGRRKAEKQKEFKTILNGVSATMPSGSLTAILGSSGSGKTTLLNTLAYRMGGGRLKITGDILYNGNPKITSIRSAYVMQQDVLLPTLTVRETLFYAAELRLPSSTSTEERYRVVEEVILELGLKECANTRIGNNVHKGCSGGEKRRTSLGVQMLANPSVLFLDEVTTGLDATSAFQLIRTLKTLAAKGRTIVVTIHQPRSEIWGLFDHLILLSEGSPVYSGPLSECLPYFEDLGHGLPAFVNPAEHLVDLVAVDSRSTVLEATSSTRVESMKQAWRDSECRILHDVNEKDRSLVDDLANVKSKSQKSSLMRQVKVLTGRTVKVTYRDPMGMAGSLLEATSMAIITGWIFLHLDGSLQGIRSKEGALYTAASFQGYLILLFETYRLTIDIQLFDREYGEGVVDVPAFLISRRLARVLIEDIPVPLIFSVVYYFMAGFRPLASQFFTFFAVTLLSQYIAVTLATLCVAFSRNFAGASLIANMAYTIQSLACGYFVQSNQIPVYVRWFKVCMILFCLFKWDADSFG
jgi:ABC-type multidrug transport system ATPase subunit